MIQIDSKLEEGKLTLKVAGRLDTNTSPELSDKLSCDGVSSVVFDFSELEYISSAGLRVLMSVQKTVMATGGSVVIVNPNSIVMGVLDMTGLSGVFEIVQGQGAPQQ